MALAGAGKNTAASALTGSTSSALRIGGATFLLITLQASWTSDRPKAMNKFLVHLLLTAAQHVLSCQRGGFVPRRRLASAHPLLQSVFLQEQRHMALRHVVGSAPPPCAFKIPIMSSKLRPRLRQIGKCFRNLLRRNQASTSQTRSPVVSALLRLHAR